MSDAAMLLPVRPADVILSLIALAGVLVVMAVLDNRRDSNDGLARRFRFVLQVCLVLLIGRLGFWGYGSGLFRYLTLLSGCLVPLAATLLTEGLLRKHAPLGLKWLLLFATPVLALLALLPESVSEPGLSVLLLSYQMIVLSICVYMLAARDLFSLSGAEHALIRRIGLAMIVCLPLLLTDYTVLFDQLPVRLGALGILALCWLAIDASTRSRSARWSVLRLTLLVCVSLFIGVLVAYLAVTRLQINGDPLTITPVVYQLIATVTAGGILLAIISDSLNHPVGSRENLLQALADGRISSQQTLMNVFHRFPLTDGAVVIEESALTEFDVPGIRSAFSMQPVQFQAELNANATFDVLDEQIASLCTRHASNCLMRLSSEPLRILALKTARLGSSVAADAELTAIQALLNHLPPTNPTVESS